MAKTQTYFQYAIAAGHGQAGSLVNIETIKPSGDKYFLYPSLAPNRLSRGLLRRRADGANYLTGLASVTWVFAGLTRAQWRYLQDTYTVGGDSYSGPVTLRTKSGETDAYANYNAVLNLPPMDGLQYKPGGFPDFEVQFTHLEAL